MPRQDRPFHYLGWTEKEPGQIVGKAKQVQGHQEVGPQRILSG